MSTATAGSDLMQPSVTHLVCDCDGVLVDSEAIAYTALLEALSTRLRNLSGKALADAVQSRLGVTTDTMIAQVAAEAGRVFPATDIAAIREQVEAAVRTQQQAVPGVADALRAMPMPIAIASNSSLPRVREAIAVCGIEALVGDRLYTADVVGKAKPAPDIYLAACAGFGVPPAQCLAVEDSVTGVTAAASAGLRVLGFAGATHLAAETNDAGHFVAHIRKMRDAGASWIFDDMNDLPRIVEAISRGDLVPSAHKQHGSKLEHVDSAPGAPPQRQT